MKTYYVLETESPVGALLLVSDGERLTAIHTRGQKHFPGDAGSWRPDAALGVLREAKRELREYFLEGRRTFDLPLGPEGTGFQTAVWEQIARIPYGHTRSYGDLAARIGRPSAARAVGAATGRNPVGIVIPCHRVVGSDGSLTGYASGLDRKRALLDHERRGGRGVWSAGSATLPGLPL